MKKIAILIPCYNEERTIATVIDDFKQQLPEADIYVYDNNSTDRTADIALAHGAIVRKEPLQGKGNVMRSMFRHIQADCYLMIDGDNTYSAADARAMCNKVLEEGADMVIADRLSTSYFDVNTRLFHNGGNRLVRALVNHIFDSHIHDIMSGYRALSPLFVKHFPILSKGFEIETEMTIFALDRNFVIYEIPTLYRDRPEGSISKLNTFSDGYRVLKTIIQLFRDYRPLLFFSLLSLLLIIVAAIMMIPVYLEYQATGLVPRFPTLIVAGFITLFAIILWTCGLILEVMGKKHRQLFELLLHH